MCSFFGSDAVVGLIRSSCCFEPFCRAILATTLARYGVGGKRAPTAGADYALEVPPGIAFSQDSSLDTPVTEM